MAFLYYILTCQLNVGSVQTNALTSVTIKSTFRSLSDTAEVVLPRNFRQAILNGKTDTLERKNIQDFIKVGDPIEIKLGYNGENNICFKGYVKKISADFPLVLECEDEMFLLRKTTFIKSYREIKLLDLLQEIAPGYQYEVVDNIQLGKFQISSASAYDVLEALKKDYLLHSYFRDKTLVVGFPVDFPVQNNHKFYVSRMRDSSGLKYTRAEDVKIQIKAISNDSNGTKKIVTVGDSEGSTRTLNFANKSEAELKSIAQKNLDTLKFDGFEGSFDTFGTQIVKVGDAVTIVDDTFDDSDRSGKYLVESVDISFSSSGFKQTIKPSLSL